MSDRVVQEQVHEALAGLIPDDGELLTGWLVAYECQAVDGSATAGHFYGPDGMTAWRALGLAEWAARHTIGPEDDDE